jgi:uroporphyrinogen-III synthase
MQPCLVSTKRLAPVLAEQLKHAGLAVVQHDFIEQAITIPDRIESQQLQENIVLTSKTAVKAWITIAEKLGIDLSKHTIFCTDQATRKEVLNAHLKIKGTAPDASSLADVIAEDHSIKAITFVCSDLRRDELPAKLATKGVTVHEIVGYQTQLTPVKIEETYQGVLFFSPSGVDSFLSLNKTSPVCFCIGRTTAEHADEKGFARVQSAEVATPESLIDTVIQYYSKNPVHA